MGDAGHTSGWVLRRRVDGPVDETCFARRDLPLAPLNDNEVLVEVLQWSMDPVVRTRLSEKADDPIVAMLGGPVGLDAVVPGRAVATVLESNAERIAPGDWVMCDPGWVRKAVLKAEAVRPLNSDLGPADLLNGILGPSGITAFLALQELGLSAGQSLLVSGAAGSVGTALCQLAALRDIRVIGLTGSGDKAEFLERDVGVHAAVNYRDASVADSVLRLCPQGVDGFADLVGGDMLGKGLAALAVHGTVLLVGSVSQYDRPDAATRHDIPGLTMARRATLRGFLVRDHRAEFPSAIGQLAELHATGKLRNFVTKHKGFEKLPQAFCALFSGANRGKMLVDA